MELDAINLHNAAVRRQYREKLYAFIAEYGVGSGVDLDALTTQSDVVMVALVDAGESIIAFGCLRAEHVKRKTPFGDIIAVIIARARSDDDEIRSDVIRRLSSLGHAHQLGVLPA
jgi:hypothetical protein